MKGHEHANEAIHRLIEEESFNVKLIVKDLDQDEVIFERGIRDVFSSASLIKVPILIAVLDYLEQKDLSLHQELPISKENCVDFSVLTEQGITASSLYELLTWMIITSDNTATNVLIDFVGMDNLNRYFKKIGLTETSVNRKMMDFIRLEKGMDNVTTAKDMATLFTHIYRRTLLSETYSELAITILSRQRVQDSLKRYLVEEVKMAHKTGSLDTVEHDVGIVFHPSKDYVIGVFIANHTNNERAKQLIGRISKTVYLHLTEKKEGVI